MGSEPSGGRPNHCLQRYDRNVKQQLFGRFPSDPRAYFPTVAWVTAITSLVLALAVAVTAAVHYRSELTTLQRHVPQTAGRSPGTAPVRLASTTVMLPPRGKLNGGVTILTARRAGGPTQVELAVHISGARPHTSYILLAFNCAGSSGYQTWATGVTNGRGTGTLVGQAMLVSGRSQYWLYVNPSSSGGGSEAGLRISLTAAGNFFASPAGNPAC
jgi:hypothetical protein